MPKIDKEFIAEFVKPDKLKLRVGDKMTFRIRGTHRLATNKEDGRSMYSVPVSYGKGQEGYFSLNKGNMRSIVDALGEDSDTWVGADFEAVAIPRNNPTTGGQVLGWSISTVKGQKKI